MMEDYDILFIYNTVSVECYVDDHFACFQECLFASSFCFFISILFIFEWIDWKKDFGAIINNFISYLMRTFLYWMIFQSPCSPSAMFIYQPSFRSKNSIKRTSKIKESFNKFHIKFSYSHQIWLYLANFTIMLIKYPKYNKKKICLIWIDWR